MVNTLRRRRKRAVDRQHQDLLQPGRYHAHCETFFRRELPINPSSTTVRRKRVEEAKAGWLSAPIKATMSSSPTSGTAWGWDLHQSKSHLEGHRHGGSIVIDVRRSEDGVVMSAMDDGTAAFRGLVMQRTPDLSRVV